MVRKAQSQDIDGLIRLLKQIANLHHQGRPDIFKFGGQKYTREELEDIINDKNRPIFVAVDDSNYMKGYCFCNLHTPAHPVMEKRLTLFIDDFCVDETIRGQGIGKKLFGEVLAYAHEQQAHNIDLNVWSFNEGAIKFYENLGFAVQRQAMEMILSP